MQPITKKVLLVLLMYLFVAALGSAALAGGNENSATVSQTPDLQGGDRLAAKAMTDDELAQVTAGVDPPAPPPPPPPTLTGSFNFINVGGHTKTKVRTTPFANKIRVGKSVKVKTLNLNSNLKPF